MAKKTYADVSRQVNALLAKQQAMEQKAVDSFVKVLMKSGTGEKLADLSGADLQAVAKLIAANMDGTIRQVRADREAKSQLLKVRSQPSGGYQYAG